VQSISVGELKSVATAGGWWSDSGLVLRRWSQAKGFNQSSCCLGGLVHDRVFRHALQESQPLQRSHPSPYRGGLARHSEDFACWTVQYPPKATSNFRNACETSSIRKQPTAKRSLRPRLIPTSSNSGWMSMRGSGGFGRWVSGCPGGTDVGGSTARFWIRLTCRLVPCRCAG